MKDPVIKPKYLERFTTGFNNFRIIKLETSGHFPQEEQPAIVAKAILGLLSE
jgi:haloalkane dehalogenase